MKLKNQPLAMSADVVVPVDGSEITSLTDSMTSDQKHMLRALGIY